MAYPLILCCYCYIIILAMPVWAEPPIGWLHIAGIGITEEFKRLHVHSGSRDEIIKICSTVCSRNISHATNPLFRTNACMRWGFSYIHISRNEGECRFPTPTWASTQGIACANIKEPHSLYGITIHSVPSIESCRIKCEEAPRNECSEFSIEQKHHSIHANHTYISHDDVLSKQFTCVLNLHNSAHSPCSEPSKYASVYYIPDDWIMKATSVERRHGMMQHYMPPAWSSSAQGRQMYSALLDKRSVYLISFPKHQSHMLNRANEALMVTLLITVCFLVCIISVRCNFWDTAQACLCAAWDNLSFRLYSAFQSSTGTTHTQSTATRAFFFTGQAPQPQYNRRGSMNV